MWRTENKPVIDSKTGLSAASGTPSQIVDNYVVVPGASAAGAGAGAVEVKAPTLKLGTNVGPIHTGMRNSLKRNQKPVKITLPYSFDFTCGVTGVTDVALAIAPSSNSTEWNAMIALFDEYKVTGGCLEFGMDSRAHTTASHNGRNFVVAYDPVDNTPLTSVRQGCELAQHKLLNASLITAGTPDVFGYLTKGGDPHRFRFVVPKDVTLTNSASVGGGGGWVSTASTIVFGYLKPYSVFGQTSAVICVSGIVYVDMELRYRK